MPLLGFEGPAGTGKTYRLIEEVCRRAVDLAPTERVLGLTFMHGSRRRLQECFAGREEIRGRNLTTTIDSFSTYVVNRWRPPTREAAGGFEAICDRCGELLEDPVIAGWVAAAFPLVVVDEAQDLCPSRLRVIAALERVTDLLVGADEFQCLGDHDTRPFRDWFNAGNVTRLIEVRRTNRAGLLNAASAIRSFRGPAIGAGLSIQYVYPNQAKFTVGHALIRGRGTRALLFSPVAGKWAHAIATSLSQGCKSPRQTVPPLSIYFETAAREEVEGLVERLTWREELPVEELVRQLEDVDPKPDWLEEIKAGVVQLRRTLGKRHWSCAEFQELADRKVAIHRAYAPQQRGGTRATSIHGAKNREFGTVVLLWGAGVQGTDEYKRRLLYNAITRGRESCTVLVQTERLLHSPPFT